MEGPDEDLEYGLYGLQARAARLRFLSIAVILSTALNFIVAIVTLVATSSVHFLDATVIGFIAASTVLLAASLLSLAMYDQGRRVGDALFEEISEELAWRDTDEKVSGRSPPKLRARVTLREYARTTDLLFVTGRLGPGLYAVTNVVIYLFAISIAAASLRGG